MQWIAAFVVVGIVSGGFASPAHAQLAGSDAVPSWGPWKKRPTITVISGEKDSRLPLVDEAVTFWNDQFIRMGSGFRLGPISHTIGDTPAYELHAKYPRPAPLSEKQRSDLIASLSRINGDILIVMTDSTAGSFATSLPPPGRKIVAVIRRVQDSMPSAAALKATANVLATRVNSPLNTIAHELGHAIGLGHSDEDGTLMCGNAFCQTRPPPIGRIYPLGETDIIRLRAWYPRNWSPYYYQLR